MSLCHAFYVPISDADIECPDIEEIKRSIPFSNISSPIGNVTLFVNSTLDAICAEGFEFIEKANRSNRLSKLPFRCESDNTKANWNPLKIGYIGCLG